MTEPTIPCPKCKAEINLMEPPAAEEESMILKKAKLKLRCENPADIDLLRLMVALLGRIPN